MEFPAKPTDKLLEKKLPFSPHFLTPAGMLLPKHQQPPPMYGPRGATVPPKFIPKYEVNNTPNFKPPSRGGRGYHGNSNHPRRSFNNTEVTLPPRNWDLWCESCDRDFPSRDLLDKHKSEHTTCGIDGCKFTGHPMIVQKHVATQHETGLYDKLKKLDTPEDIMKWREERKRKYPTQANIDLKQRAKVAREERGEKLEQPKGKFNQHQKNQNQKKQNNRKNNRNKNKRNNNQDKTGAKGETRPVVAVDEVEVNQGIPMFQGTRGMWDDDDKVLGVEVEKEKTPEVKDVPKNPLLALIGMYGDGSDEEEESEVEDAPVIVVQKIEDKGIVPPSPEEVAVDNKDTITIPESVQVKDNSEHVAEEEEETVAVSTNNSIQSEDLNKPSSSSPGKKKPTPEKRVHPQQNNSNQHNDKKKRVLKSGLNYSSLKRTKPNTLLFKLLQGEIRHERNVLLQAVRYVVENDYFDDKEKE